MNSELIPQETAVDFKKEEVLDFLSEAVFPMFELSEEDEDRRVVEHIALAEQSGSLAQESVERASFENIRAMLTSFFSYFAERGEDYGALLPEVYRAYAEVRDSAFIAYTDDPQDFQEILRDEHIRSVFQLPGKMHRSATGEDSLRRQIRRRIERELGFEEESAPVYMAMGSRRDRHTGPAGTFGPIYTEFAVDAFKESAVFIVGDSMNTTGTPRAVWPNEQPLLKEADLVSSALGRRLRADHVVLAKALYDVDADHGYSPAYRPLRYIEAVIPGPVRMGEAQRVCLNMGDTSHTDSLVEHFSNVAQFKELLEERHKLPLSVVGERPSYLDDPQVSFIVRDSYNKFYATRK